jgi:hypothetical protein
MPITTPTFTEEINDVFGNNIKDGRIICSERDFKRGFRQLKRQLNLSGKQHSGGGATRKKSTFMVWLNTERREQLKDEYFSDFDTYSDWSEDGIRQYYESKELPLDKLEALIEKKKRDGKEIKKPRLMALITIKAGLIWSDMTDEEKANYSDIDNDSISSMVNSTKKKGRPSGYKAKNYVVDSSVEMALKNNSKMIEDDVTDEEIELDDFEFEGVNYYKDENNNIYDLEFSKIGVFKDGIITK